MDDQVCIEENLFRLDLSKTLPAYMVPGTIVALPEMPRMPSGKINRKALPVPEALLAKYDQPAREAIDLSAPASDRILAVLHEIFPNREIDTSMDFFDNLGGHSLLAAGFVSQLRRDAGLPHVSIKDVYLYRPVGKLIAEWDKEPQTQKLKESSFQKVPAWR